MAAEYQKRPQGLHQGKQRRISRRLYCALSGFLRAGGTFGFLPIKGLEGPLSEPSRISGRAILDFWGARWIRIALPGGGELRAAGAGRGPGEAEF